MTMMIPTMLLVIFTNAAPHPSSSSIIMKDLPSYEICLSVAKNISANLKKEDVSIYCVATGTGP